MMKSSKADKIIELVRTAGILRPRDLDSYGIPREYLRRLYREGFYKQKLLKAFAGGPGGRFSRKESPWPPEAKYFYIRRFELVGINGFVGL